ncbi:hypothetical protein BLA15816_07914 [Burkholderia lata]|nr:hypothetical protein BLA15816_07914 [Burkholderia lata]
MEYEYDQPRLAKRLSFEIILPQTILRNHGPMPFRCKGTNPIVVFRIRCELVAEMYNRLNGFFDFRQLPNGVSEVH